MGTEIVKYGSYTVEDATADAEELGKGTNSYFKPIEGKNRLRFIPPRIGGRATVVVHQHVINVPGSTNPLSFNCPRMMAKKPCPACAKVDQLRATGNAADYDAAGELLPKVRVYANIIDRKNPEKGPQVFAYGKTVHKELVALRADEDSGGDFMHPIDGFDVIVVREGQGLQTKYVVRRIPTNSPLAPDTETMNAWIEGGADLEAFAAVPSVEEIKAKLGGASTATDSTKQRSGATRAPAGAKGRTASDDMTDED